MKQLAIIQLRIEGTDQSVFQRRDGDAPTSPHMLSFFGGQRNPGEGRKEAAARELTEETSLKAGGIALEHIVSVELPHGMSGNAEPLELDLFSATIPNADFEVYEGSGCEIYSRSDALSRSDLAPTARFLLAKGYAV